MFPPLGQPYREEHRGKGASGSCHRKHIPLLATLLQYRPRIFHTTRFILEGSSFFAIHPSNFTSSQSMASPIFFNTLEVITEGRKEVRALLELHFLICRVSGKEYQKRLSETHSGSFKKKKKKVLLFFADISQFVEKALCLYFRQPHGKRKNLCMSLIKPK